MPTPYMTNEDFFDVKKVMSRLGAEEFRIPISQSKHDYFPTFLKKRIDKYKAFFNSELKPCLEESSSDAREILDLVYSELGKVSTGILKAVNEYYAGKVHEASNTFDKMLNDIEFKSRQATDTLPNGTFFYRTRASNTGVLPRAGLFHNPF